MDIMDKYKKHIEDKTGIQLNETELEKERDRIILKGKNRRNLDKSEKLNPKYKLYR
jgi:hypothetical protein